jgi:hypothetical protein
MNWPEMAEAVKFMRGGDVGFCFAIEPGLEEDQVWHKTVLPLLTGLPANVLDIWQYCVTEMVNNAIDHSNGSGETRPDPDFGCVEGTVRGRFNFQRQFPQAQRGGSKMGGRSHRSHCIESFFCFGSALLYARKRPGFCDSSRQDSAAQGNMRSYVPISPPSARRDRAAHSRSG